MSLGFEETIEAATSSQAEVKDLHLELSASFQAHLPVAAQSDAKSEERLLRKRV